MYHIFISSPSNRINHYTTTIKHSSTFHIMGGKDPTGELGKVAETLPDIADPDAGLSEEERQAIVGPAPISMRIPPC